MQGGPQRIGVLGGSFDPPHVGHLVIASEAHWRLGLQQVLFVPAADPPHKRLAGGVEAADRLLMVRAAVAGDARFAVSDIEVRGSLRYTVDTLTALHEMLPQAQLFFVAGSDSLLALPTWRQPERILQLCRWVVALRPGDDEDEARAAANQWGEAVTVMDAPRIGVSSTEVRQRLGRGRPVRYLVPEAVERIIAREGWYQGP